MRHILVIGGAGYIGSHMVAKLLDDKQPVVVLDNLSTGYQKAVLTDNFVNADYADPLALDRLFSSYDISAVMHFAASSIVAESVQQPDKYYQNNVANTLVLLDKMRQYQVNTLIFSSTAAIFGEVTTIPIPSNANKSPVNPYGRSKWMIEQILKDYDHAYAIKSICLRYFNAAGADPKGRLGENHQPETHLIPLVLQAASGRRDSISIFGDDYDTPDGTCIRDYIHVSDLCDAHCLALNHLKQYQRSCAFNLGNGNGFSVAQIIESVRQITGKSFTVKKVKRRHGDPARLVADASEAIKQLGWQTKYHDIVTIIEHAWAWEQKQLRLPH